MSMHIKQITRFFCAAATLLAAGGSALGQYQNNDVVGRLRDIGQTREPAARFGTVGAERTRYTELMADAMAGYFLTHKRGAAMNRHRVAQFLAVFFQVGDCAFDFPSHHGTPN